MSHCIHVIPTGGEEPVHWASGACWCCPTRQPVIAEWKTQLQPDTPCLLHNAQDARERFERQGLIKDGHSWAVVAGAV